MLISNLLLLSKGNYDAWVRQVVKMVCIGLLQQQNQQQLQPPKLQAMCLLKTTSSKQQESPQDSNDDDDIEQHHQFMAGHIHYPKMTFAKTALMQFEQIEKAITTHIFKAMVKKEHVCVKLFV